MTTVSDRTLKLIKQKHIEPISKRRLIVYWALLWSLVALFIIMGSLVISIVFYGILDNDWGIFTQAGLDFAGDLVQNAPLFIFLCALICVLIASTLARSTKQGYHFRRRFLIGISLGLSLLLGFLIQLFGIGTQIDMIADEKIPSYTSVQQRELNLWKNPAHGLLAGEIESIENNTLKLRDLSGNLWTVAIPSNINPVELMNICKNIKIVGTQQDNETFLSKEIHPWTSKFYNCLSLIK